MLAGYLLGQHQSKWGVAVALIGCCALFNAMYVASRNSTYKHLCRLTKLDEDDPIPTSRETSRFMRRGMFETNKTYRVEAISQFRTRNIVVVQEEGCPIGSPDSVRIFATHKPVGRRLKFFVRRDVNGKRIWDFESVEADRVQAIG